MAIDLLGTIAARLKRDAVIHKLDKYWITRELNDGENATESYPYDLCSVCLDGRVEKLLFACESCQRSFHSDCMGVREQEVPNQSWNCQFCICRKQLMVLQSFCKSQCKEDKKNSSELFGPITKVEIVQQLLLNYLQDTGAADDLHLFVRWCVVTTYINVLFSLLFYVDAIEDSFFQVLSLPVVQGRSEVSTEVLLLPF